MATVEAPKENVPKGVRGFEGRGSVENNRIPFTLADLHRGELPRVVYALYQLHAEDPISLSKKNR